MGCSRTAGSEQAESPAPPRPWHARVPQQHSTTGSTNAGIGAAALRVAPGAERRQHFSVASYNILADKYAMQYRHFLYAEVPHSHLAWHHRCRAIVRELAELAPDVICLQEVDQYHDLKRELEPLGYESVFVQRSGGRRDGCATFWRAHRLHATHVRRVRFHDYDLSDNVALLVALQPLGGDGNAAPDSSGVESSSGGSRGGEVVQEELAADVGLLVANTHIIFAPERGDVKLGQVRTLVQAASDMARLLSEADQDAWAHPPPQQQQAGDGVGSVTAQRKLQLPPRPRRYGTIVCGDFNALPGSPVYDFVSTGELDLSSVNRRNVTGALKSSKGYKSGQHSRRGGSGATVEITAAAAAGVVEQQQPQQQQAQSQQQQEEQQHTAAVNSAVSAACAGLGGLTVGATERATRSTSATVVAPLPPPLPAAAPGAAAASADAAAAPTAAAASAAAAAAMQFLPPPVQQQQSSRSSGGGAGGQSALSRAASAIAGAAGALIDRIGSASATASGVVGSGGSTAAAAAAAVALSSAEWLGTSPGGPRWSEKELRRAAGPGAIAISRQRRSLERERQQQPQSPELPHDGTAAAAAASPAVGAAVPAAASGLSDCSPAPSPLPEEGTGGLHDTASPPRGAIAGGVSFSGGDDAIVARSGWASASGGGSSGRLKQPPALLMRHPLKLRSSYLEVLGREPEFTSSHLKFHDTCDFIWYSEDLLGRPASPVDQSNIDRSNASEDLRLQPVAVLLPPDRRYLPRGLPSQHFGSDHLCLMSVFELGPAAAGPSATSTAAGAAAAVTAGGVNGGQRDSDVDVQAQGDAGIVGPS